MSLKTITPESLRSDAQKMLARADALEQKVKFFSGKTCEFCGETKRFVNSARCVNSRIHDTPASWDRGEAAISDHAKLNAMWKPVATIGVN